MKKAALHTKHTHSHLCSHRNEGKTNKRGWGQGPVCVGPWGHSGVQTPTGLHLGSVHKGVGFMETKKTNRAILNRSAQWFKKSKRRPNFSSNTPFYDRFWSGPLSVCGVYRLASYWFCQVSAFVCQHMNQHKKKKKKPVLLLFFHIEATPPAKVNIVGRVLGKLQWY